MGDPALTLQEAADLLGVHYMTAYRYIRLGQLDATKSAGGWQVRASAIEAFRSSRRTDVPPRHRAAPWHERLESRLIAGDAAGAWNVVEAAMASGATVADTYLDVMTRALSSIGDRWEAGEIDVAIEHRASVIASRLIGRLGTRCARRGRARGGVLIGCPAGERHAIASAMLADILRLEGWDVSDLGADTPPSSFVAVAGEIDALTAIGMSVTRVDALAQCATTCASLREAGVTAPLLVGGQAIRDDDHARDLGADAHPGDAAGLIAALDRLVDAGAA